MSQQYRSYRGETYLTKIQAEIYTNHSEGWLKTRVEKGILKKYTLDDLSINYYKRSELDAALAPKEEQDAPPDADYLKISQVARKLQLTQPYVWQLVDAGTLKAINVSGKHGKGAIWRIHKDDYERFIKEREQARERELMQV